MKERNIREYMTTVKCSVCGEHYQFDNVSILGHQDEVWLLSVFCDSCKTRGLVAALVKEVRHDGAGAVPGADHPVDEQAAAVSIDDFLDMHNFLRSFDGDFRKLFGGD